MVFTGFIISTLHDEESEGGILITCRGFGGSCNTATPVSFISSVMPERFGKNVLQNGDDGAETGIHLNHLKWTLI